MSIKGMYGVGVCYFYWVAPIKEILFYYYFARLIEGVMSTFFKGGGKVLFQFCHLAKVRIILKTI
jgi:hypothetical protein